MLARRTHRKSRNGCSTCKDRKIKCDELKPVCKYCSKRSIQCTYSSAKSLSPSIRSRVPNEQSIPSPKALTPSTSAPSPAFSPDHLTTSRQWDLCDLELLHFYTASTSLTFSNVPERRHVWQYVVPKIAFSHNFLLHGLLALSALHLSRTELWRKDSLLARASTHHATALPLFRSAVSSINPLNCHACSAFGTIIAIYEWASSEHARNLFFADAGGPSESSTIEWVQLLRGSGRLISCFYEEIMQGPLEPILTWDNAAELSAVSTVSEPARFLSLEELWDVTKISVSTTEAESLEESLRWLKITYTMISAPNSNIDPASTALSWLVRVPELYLQMVNARHPAALILLAHFCLLLNKVEDFWWICGMSRDLLQEIHQTLGEEWETWISWPLQDLVLCEFKKQSSK